MEDAFLTDLDCVGGGGSKISFETRHAISQLSEMLAAMERVSVQGMEAFTTRELMAAMGIGQKRCVELVRRAIQTGKVRVCRKSITDLAGRVQAVAAYERVG